MRRTLIASIAMLSLGAGWSAAASREANVCFDPARPCGGFGPHDLSFPLAPDGVARGEARSAPFFAVVLKTVRRCRASEKERVEIQAIFPAHKVFASRFECDGDIENNVTYTNVDPKMGFIAVYAGESRAAANEVLAKAKSLRRFAGANMRRMQVIRVSP